VATEITPALTTDPETGTDCGDGSLAARVRASVRSRRAGLAEGVLYAAWALVLVWPVPLAFGRTSLAHLDGEFYLWMGWRIGELISHGEWPLFIPDVGVPDGYHVGLGDGVGPYLILGLTNVVLQPVVALNAVVVGALFANALAGRALARASGATHRSTWVITALALASAPALIVRAPVHFHFLFAFVGALIIAEAVRFARRVAPIRVVRLGVLFAAAFYVSFYWFVSSLFAFVVIVGIAALREREALRSAARLAAVFALAALLVCPIVIPRLEFVSRESGAAGSRNAQETERTLNAVNYYSADVLSVLTSPEGTRLTPPGVAEMQATFTVDGNQHETAIYPGAIMVLALACFAFMRGPLRLPVIVAAATVWILSLGPVLHVAGLVMVDGAGRPLDVLPASLLRSLPFLDALRTPSRLAFTLPLLTAVALAVTAERVASSRLSTGRRLGLGALACALLATNLIRPVTTPGELPTELTQALRGIAATAGPTDAVVEVPFDPSLSVETIRLQMLHQRPTLGFHGQWAALPWFSGFDEYKASRALAELRCDPRRIAYANVDFPEVLKPSGLALAELRRDFGVRYLLVDAGRLTGPECRRRRYTIERVIAPARVVARSGGWRVLEIPG
jgi:hypothetical protein